jgi:hypothetical protein
MLTEHFEQREGEFIIEISQFSQTYANCAFIEKFQRSRDDKETRRLLT